MKWGGWLPHNRHFQTEVLSLAEASASAIEDYDPLDRQYGYPNCRQCGEPYAATSAPWGYSKYCTQVCVNAAKRAQRDGVPSEQAHRESDGARNAQKRPG